MSSSKIPVIRKSTMQPSVPTLKRSNSQTSIPVLRRSNSHSSIPTQARQSRSSVRGPSQGRLRTKSLATKSPIVRNSNFLHPTSGIGKVRSLSNIRAVFTPQQEKRDNSPYSIERRLRSAGSISSVTKDLRPLNDKEWQREQLAKVKSCLSILDPALPSIKPLSVSVFIDVMNLLSQHFDNRIVITQENYKDEVIMFLKRFSYPGNVKPSLIKNLSAPHEFPKVLAILSWLVDRVDVITNSDRIVRPIKVPEEDVDLYHMLLSYNIEKFKLWNQNEEAGADEHLYEQLNIYHDIPSLDIEKKVSELEALNATVASLEQTKTSLDLEKKIAQLRKENEEMSNTNLKYVQQWKQFLETNNSRNAETLSRIESVKQLIHEEDNSKKELQDIVDAQKHNFVEYNDLNKKIQEINHSVKLYQDRMEEQTQVILNDEEKISTLKSKLEENVHKYNNVISKLSFINSDLSELKVRESGFMEPSFAAEMVDKTVKKKNTYMTKFEVLLKGQEKEHQKISAENQDSNLDLDKMMEELNDLTSRVNDHKSQLDELINIRKTEINDEQTCLDKLNKTLAVQKTRGENKVEKYRNKVQEASTDLPKLKENLKIHRECAEELNANMTKTLFENIARNNEHRKAISDAIIEAFTGTIIPEEVASQLGIDLSSLQNDINDENET